MKSVIQRATIGLSQRGHALDLAIILNEVHPHGNAGRRMRYEKAQEAWTVCTNNQET